MRRLLAALFVTVALAGCGGPSGPTAVPLTNLDLEPLAIQPGDLPAGFSGAQVNDTDPGMFKDAPKPTKLFDQRLQKGDKNAGGVTILLYENTDDLTKAYDTVVDGMDDANAVVEVGEAGRVSALDLGVTKISEGVFRHCHALVFVRFGDTKNAASVEAYMKRLDKRLQPAVCR